MAPASGTQQPRKWARIRMAVAVYASIKKKRAAAGRAALQRIKDRVELSSHSRVENSETPRADAAGADSSSVL